MSLYGTSISGLEGCLGGDVGAAWHRAMQDRRGASFVNGCETASAEPYQLFSPRLAVNPMGRRLGAGGCMSWRIAERMAAMA